MIFYEWSSVNMHMTLVDLHIERTKHALERAAQRVESEMVLHFTQVIPTEMIVFRQPYTALYDTLERGWSAHELLFWDREATARAVRQIIPMLTRTTCDGLDW